MSVKVYVLHTEFLENETVFQDKYNHLSKEKQKKISKIHTRKKQICSLGKELLFTQICEIFHIENPDIALGEFGKPYFVAYPDVHFNFSHSGDYILCAVYNHPIGADIQAWKSVNDNIGKKIFTSHEQKSFSLAERDNHENLFFRYWTSKESYIKLTGQGLRQGLQTFSVNLDAATISDSTHTEQKIYIKEYRCFYDYSITICSYHNDFPKFVNRIIYRIR